LAKKFTQARKNTTKMPNNRVIAYTGEGGLSPYHLEGGADIVFQIGTAKYGVRDEQGHLSDEKLIGVSDASSSSVGKGQLAKITVPTGLRFLVDPNATVVSCFFGWLIGTIYYHCFYL
jgi:hypothetical protein